MREQVNYKPIDMWLLYLSSCFLFQVDQQLTATAEDPWGQPIINTTFKIPEYKIEIFSKDGTATLNEKTLFSKGYNEILIEASAPEFINAQNVLEHDYGSPFGTSITLILFPDLKDHGVYAKGSDEYIRLSCAPTMTLSSDLEYIEGFHSFYSNPLTEPHLLSYTPNVLAVRLYKLNLASSLTYKDKTKIKYIQFEILKKDKQIALNSSVLKGPNLLLHTFSDFDINHYYLLEEQLENSQMRRYLFHKKNP